MRKNLNLNDLVLQNEEVSEVAWMPASKLLELAKGEDETFVDRREEYKKLYEILKSPHP